MVLSKKKKSEVIAKHRRHDKDTGSSEVQVAILNERIKKLTDVHFKKNKKDLHSKKGLLGLVAKRRKHEKFIATKKVSKKST